MDPVLGSQTMFSRVCSMTCINPLYRFFGFLALRLWQKLSPLLEWIKQSWLFPVRQLLNLGVFPGGTPHFDNFSKLEEGGNDDEDSTVSHLDDLIDDHPDSHYDDQHDDKNDDEACDDEACRRQASQLHSYESRFGSGESTFTASTFVESPRGILKNVQSQSARLTNMEDVLKEFCSIQEEEEIDAAYKQTTSIGTCTDATELRECLVAASKSEDIPDVTGNVHSVESMSAVDGPGLRYLVFLQGCPRKCGFCGNPDSWELGGGKEMNSKKVIKQVRRCRPYLRPNGGGITLSGGEPMLQPFFVATLFKEAHLMGLTTCLDTTGWGSSKDWELVLPHTDLVLLCLKSFDPKKYKQLTKTHHKHGFKFAEELSARKVPFWLRYVMLPGITDSEEELSAMEEFVRANQSCKGIELLPYHKLGVEKWNRLGMEYPLQALQPPSRAMVAEVQNRFQAHGIEVLAAN